MASGTAVQKTLKCEFCGTTTTKSGKAYTSETGMRYHMLTCIQNPHRKTNLWKGKKHGTRRAEAPSSNGSAEAELERHIAFAYGHCKTFLDLYAESLGIPGAALTHRVGEILFRSARRQLLGAFDPVSSVRRGAANGT